jgi:hypothetical protein
MGRYKDMQGNRKVSASASDVSGHRKNCSVLGVLVVLILSGMSLVSCSDNAVLTAIKQQASGVVSHWYTAGQVGPSSSNTVPVYWKDGNLNYLPLSQGMTNGYGGQISEDSSGNIYVFGGQWNSTTPVVYGYWKNSNFTAVSLGSYYTMFQQNWFVIDPKGNLWLEGNAYNSSTSSWTPVYWENQVGWVVVPSASTVCNDGLDAQGNVYFTGTIGGTSSNGDWTPAYWINGANPTALPLSSGIPYGQPLDVRLDTKGNLYFSGAEWSATSTSPVYWEEVNGTWSVTPLQKGIYSGWSYWNVHSMSVDGSGNVYAVASIGPTSTATTPETTLVYWKGATSNPTALSVGGNTYVDSHIYVGIDENGNLLIQSNVGSSSSATIPVYWENGNLASLPIGSGNSFGAAWTIWIGP